MLAQVFSQLLFFLTADCRFPAAPMDLWLKRSHFALLANKLSHDGATDGKSHSQDRVTSFFALIGGDNSFPQIDR